MDMNVKMHPVQSSNISAVGYSHDPKGVVVAFRGARAYLYPGTEAHHVGAIIQAESAGKYVNARFVKGKQPHRELVGQLRPVLTTRSPGFAIGLREWTMERFNQAMEWVTQVAQNPQNEGKVDLERAHILLPSNAPASFVEQVAAWVQEQGGNPDLDLSVGDREGILTITHYEGFVWQGALPEPEHSTAMANLAKLAQGTTGTIANDSDTTVEDQDVKDDGIVPKQRERTTHNPRRLAAVGGNRDTLEDWLAALALAFAAYAQQAGQELSVWLPYNAPEALVGLLEDKGIRVSRSDDRPTPYQVGVGVETRVMEYVPIEHDGKGFVPVNAPVEPDEIEVAAADEQVADEPDPSPVEAQPSGLLGRLSGMSF